jgi:putative acyl-CoA dehydrogenase
VEGRKVSDFYQDPPVLTNTFTGNRWLSAYLRFKLPHEMYAHIEPDLSRFGALCASEFLALARTAEREKPVHIPFDPWGRRIDEIRVSKAWVELQNISAREGLIATGYKRAHGEHSRLHQFAKLYLFHPSSAFFTCPLAMADGAAKVLENYGKDEIHAQAFSHLTSESPQEFWTSGQWMTEKTGGSDVGDTSTVVKVESGQARLYGTKWFSSATTSQMALALARREGAPQGSRGLTLYFVPMYRKEGGLNHIRVHRLKDKLGTWALPTAELELEGTHAFQIGETDQGVKTVATMLNVTRLYNSVCSIGQMTRPLELLRDYSSRRKVFGAALNSQPLHFSTFAVEELKLLAGFLLTMELVHILGKEECGKASAEDSEILRLMTPVCKLFTARAAIQTSSECIEGFGGAGYIEDTGLPVHLRDSQVFPIWEGATNVLSLDMMRVMQKGTALQALQKTVTEKLKGIRSPEVAPYRDQLLTRLQTFQAQLEAFMQAPPETQLSSSRDLAFYLARLYSFVLLLDWAERGGTVKKQLLPWIELYQSRFLGAWSPTSTRDVELANLIWNMK